MGGRPSLGVVLDDLHAEQQDLRSVLDAVDLDTPTPAEGWTVRDTVAHLAGFDVEALLAVRDPEAFLAKLPAVAADIDGFMRGHSAERAGLSREELLGGWARGAADLVEALHGVDPAAKVPWYGPPMNPVSFATARLMECWAHGQDVADAAGVQRVPTARLRHVCHLGVRTRGFSFSVRGLEPPTADVRVELDAPDSSRWEFGDPGAPDRVTGTAEDFCLLVTQRRHRADTGLLATGPVADAWLDVAQCFAGPPSAGRPPR